MWPTARSNQPRRLDFFAVAAPLYLGYSDSSQHISDECLPPRRSSAQRSPDPERQRRKRGAGKTPFLFAFWFALGELSSVIFFILFFAVWRSLSRSLVWPQSALCETSGIEE